MRWRAPRNLPRSRAAHVLQLRTPIRPCALGLGAGRGRDAHGLLVEGARRGVVAWLSVARCSTVGDDDRQHRGCFSEGIHHVLAIQWVVAGELVSFFELLGQVPRRRGELRVGMADCPVAERHRWVVALGLGARGGVFAGGGGRRGEPPPSCAVPTQAARAARRWCRKNTRKAAPAGRGAGSTRL